MTHSEDQIEDTTERRDIQTHGHVAFVFWRTLSQNQGSDVENL